MLKKEEGGELRRKKKGLSADAVSGGGGRLASGRGRKAGGRGQGLLWEKKKASKKKILVLADPNGRRGGQEGKKAVGKRTSSRRQD